MCCRLRHRTSRTRRAVPASLPQRSWGLSESPSQSDGKEWRKGYRDPAQPIWIGVGGVIWALGRIRQADIVKCRPAGDVTPVVP
jgi:hypothetical protein